MTEATRMTIPETPETLREWADAREFEAHEWTPPHSTRLQSAAIARAHGDALEQLEASRAREERLAGLLREAPDRLADEGNAVADYADGFRKRADERSDRAKQWLKRIDAALAEASAHADTLEENARLSDEADKWCGEACSAKAALEASRAREEEVRCAECEEHLGVTLENSKRWERDCLRAERELKKLRLGSINAADGNPETLAYNGIWFDRRSTSDALTELLREARERRDELDDLADMTTRHMRRFSDRCADLALQLEACVLRLETIRETHPDIVLDDTIARARAVLVSENRPQLSDCPALSQHDGETTR